jgi:hypothetical protein
VTDQWQFACFGDKEVELARRLARARRTVAVWRRELLAPQRQSDARVAKGQRDGVAVAGDDDALFYVAGIDRAVAHVLALPVAGSAYVKIAAFSRYGRCRSVSDLSLPYLFRFAGLTGTSRSSIGGCRSRGRGSPDQVRAGGVLDGV